MALPCYRPVGRYMACNQRLSRARERNMIILSGLTRQCFHIPIPMDTLRNNNVIATSKRRCDVVLTSKWRYYCVEYPLGCCLASCDHTFNSLRPGASPILVNIDSDNGPVPFGYHAITWTNAYWQLNPWKKCNQILTKCSFQIKCIWKCRLQNVDFLVQTWICKINFDISWYAAAWLW